MRGDQARAVDFHLIVFADQTELHGEPEKSSHAGSVFFIVGSRSHLAVVLEEIGEDRIRVERNVAKNVVEDVGLGQVIELLALPNGDRGGKFSERKALKERFRRDIAVNRYRFPSRRRSESPIDFGEVRNRFLLQANRIGALEENAAAVRPQLLHAALVKHPPNFVVLLRVGVPILLDENGAILYEVVKLRRRMLLQG